MKYQPQLIKKRDCFTCLKCGGTGDYKTLETHHLVGRGRWPAGAMISLHDPINLVTLCLQCHNGITNHTDKAWKDWEIKPTFDVELDLRQWWEARWPSLAPLMGLAMPQNKVILHKYEMPQMQRADLGVSPKEAGKILLQDMLHGDTEGEAGKQPDTGGAEHGRDRGGIGDAGMCGSGSSGPVSPESREPIMPIRLGGDEERQASSCGGNDREAASDRQGDSCQEGQGTLRHTGRGNQKGDHLHTGSVAPQFSSDWAPWSIRRSEVSKRVNFKDLETHCYRGTAIDVSKQWTHELVDKALACQDEVAALIRGVAEDHKLLAVRVYELHENYFWRVNHETIGDYLKDPKVGLTRDGYYRLVGFGRLLSAHPEPEKLPILNPTIWQKDIVPCAEIVDGKLTNREEVEAIAADAERLPYHDFQKTMDKKRSLNKLPCPMDGSEMVYDLEGNLRGFVNRAWGTSRGVAVILRLDTEAMNDYPGQPLRLEIRKT